MNEEIRGVTAIDTMYELKGFQMAQSFYDVIFPWAIGILAAAAVVHLLFMADRTRRFRDIVIYSGYVLAMLYLAYPIRVNVAVPAGYVWEDFEAFYRDYDNGSRGQPTVKAPRFMVWSHILCDNVTKLLMNKVNKSFMEAPFGMERLSALLRQARIHDSGLEERYQAFVLSCYVPALTMYGPSAPPSPPTRTRLRHPRRAASGARTTAQATRRPSLRRSISPLSPIPRFDHSGKQPSCLSPTGPHPGRGAVLSHSRYTTRLGYRLDQDPIVDFSVDVKKRQGSVERAEFPPNAQPGPGVEAVRGTCRYQNAAEKLRECLYRLFNRLPRQRFTVLRHGGPNLRFTRR